MNLLAFRVQKYKNITDSGWIDITSLTTLVGKNESGKTSLLRALHKLNPFQQEPYDMNVEWPRGMRRDRDPSQVVCSVKFQLNEEEKTELSELIDEQINIDFLEVTKNYDSKFEVIFPRDVLDKLGLNYVNRIYSSLTPTQPVGEQFQQELSKCTEEIVRFVKKNRLFEVENTAEQHRSRLQKAHSNESQQPHFNNEQSYAQQYSTILTSIHQNLQDMKAIQQKIKDYIINNLPTFIYMDDYKTFKGTAHLNEVKQRKDTNRLSEEDKTFLMILSLSGLELELLVNQGNEHDREQRQYDLNDGGLTLTKEIEGRWRQLRYEVTFNADGQQFFTFVKGVNDSKLIKLEERSKGFQWFFSFDLMFMSESKGSFEGCVLLLDEPGLHLHPEAQRDLLARLEEYAKGNTLIYSTHLPFMINLRHPERIHVITESNGSVVVSSDLTGTKPDEKLTLQAALGLGGETSFLLAEKNLVVEGVDDYWILASLSNLFIRAGEEGLNDDVLITPAGGASEAAYIATLMIGQKLDVVVLLDSDPAGNQAKDKLVKTWLTRYQGKPTQVLSLGEIAGFPNQEFSIEDLFPDDFYWKFVKKVYTKRIANFHEIHLDVTPCKQLCKRVNEAFEKTGNAFNKGSVSKEIRNTISRIKDCSDLPQEIVEKTRKVIQSINQAFPSTLKS